ncbi:hypothetical protein PWT90_08144 [Aphanocladium album]|nr:hypothetical protein PWT90_08144 [Aphanocladium album]
MKFTQIGAAATLFLASLGRSSPLESADSAADAAFDPIVDGYDEPPAGQPPTEGSAAFSILSGCNQGTCPDNALGFDLYSWKSGGKWRYKIRWQGTCGCSEVGTSSDGCGTLDICSGRQKVCIDYGRGRGHWISPNGDRRCYAISSDYVCTDQWEAWPTKEVPCAW